MNHNDTASSNPRAIVGLCVDQLFGYYSYQLPDPTQDYADLARLFILYGDNGSGKTTLLQLLYHLLSPDPQAGHRVHLLTQPFQRFEVQLADGTSVVAERKQGSIEGPYVYSILRDGQTLGKLSLDVSEDSRIRIRGKQRQELIKITELLANLDLDLYFLSDDRRVLGWIEGEETDIEPHYVYDSELRVRRRIPARGQRVRGGLPLEPVINRTVDWVRQQTLIGSSLGLASANTIYTDVIKRIAMFPEGEEKIPPEQVKALLQTLDDLTHRSPAFADLGLTSPLDLDEITHALRDASPDIQPLIYTVIKPYVDGTVARLDALQGIKDLITTFTENINRFYVQKHVEFTPGRGLRVISRHNQPLDPSALSSGEKQLLLLFCSALIAREKSSIFIIDEPEISLNVKWQRNLIDALLQCVRDSPVQFLLATHSIELLARHRGHVVQLVDLSNEN